MKEYQGFSILLLVTFLLICCEGSTCREACETWYRTCYEATDGDGEGAASVSTEGEAASVKTDWIDKCMLSCTENKMTSGCLSCVKKDSCQEIEDCFKENPRCE